MLRYVYFEVELSSGSNTGVCTIVVEQRQIVIEKSIAIRRDLDVMMNLLYIR